MVGEVIAARNLQYTPVTAWDYIGYYVEKKKFFAGVEYDWPNILEFATEELRIRPDAKKAAGFGEVEKVDYPPWICWYHELDLASGEPPFFELKWEEQMKRLTDFLDQCLAAGERVAAKGKARE